MKRIRLQTGILVEPEELPQILRELINDQLMPITAVGRRAGIGENSLMNWVKGKNVPRLDSLCYVLDVLGKRLVIVDKEKRYG